MQPLLTLRFLPLYLALLGAISAGIVFGAIPIHISEIVWSFFDTNSVESAIKASETGFQKSILLELRLPRILLGITVGIALGMSGACFQALFKNPLADPGIVGVSAGSATGAICYIVIVSEQWPVASYVSLPIFAMLGALVATTLLFMLSHGSIFIWRSHKRSNLNSMNTATLLLAGIAINALFTSLNGVLIFFSDEQQLRELTFWSLGSLTRADNVLTIPVLVAVLIIAAININYATAINALSLGDNQAFFLGYPAGRIKATLLVVNTCAIGSVVALSGIIGFVGLVIPHVARMLFGANNRLVLPASAFLGATALILADIVSRTIVLPAEMPIGVITGLIGSPFFIWLLVSSGQRE